MINYFIYRANRYLILLLLLILISILFSLPVYADNPRIRIHQINTHISVKDVKTEIEFGRELAARIIGKYQLYNNDNLTRYVNLIGKSIATASNRPEINFTIGILDTDTINAFAAPGGFIFITKGIIDIVDDEAQLAGIIAHEIVHISQKHIVKELNIVSPESSPVLGFARLINASHDPARVAFTKVIDEAITILFERGYKKIDEIEADTMGVLLASSLGYDPTGLIKFLEKIKSIPGQEVASYKNLYPPIEDRIKYIRQKIKKEGLSAETFRIRRKRLIDYKS